MGVLSTTGDVEGEFERFREMHTRQWQSKGRPGHFNAWRGASNYNLDLVKKLIKKQRVRLIYISANTTVISYEYGFVFGKMLFWESSARLVGHEWNAFDLGHTGALI